MRPAVAEDADAIARVHVSAWQRAYDGLLPDDLLAAQSVAVRTRAWRRHLTEPQDALTWVAGDAGEPVRGFVTIGPSRDGDVPAAVGELYVLYVHPASWDGGWGSRLMDVATEALERRYDGVATLWVLDANERARRFYEKRGWRTDGTVKQETRAAVVLQEVRYRLTW